MNENNLSNKLSRIDGAISAIKTNLSIEQSTPIESVVEIIGDGKAEPESNGLYLTQSIDEMNTIANPNENDICIVFAPQTTVTAESTFTQISIPAKVTGAGGITSRSGTFTNAEGTEELRISLASFGSSLTITIMTETDYASIRYSKSGTVYTRTGEVTETETYYFSSPLSLKSSSNWNDFMNSFLILDAGGLEGLYKYQNSTWSYLDIGIDTVGEQILNGKKAYTNKGLITGSFGLWNSRGELDTFKSLMNSLDTSKIEDFSSYFSECNDTNILAIIPMLDTSSATNMKSMFLGCSSLTSIPELNTSNVTEMVCTFQNCSSLTTIPMLNTSKVTNMDRMVASCSALTTFPKLDTSKVTNMYCMFTRCSALTEIPELDTSSVTNMERMFSGCTSLTTIPKLNTSNVTNAVYTFQNCTSLTTLPELDMSKASNIEGMFSGCSALKNVDGLLNLGQAFSDQYATLVSHTLDLSACVQLTHDSLLNIINNIYDLAAAGKPTQKLILGSTNLAKLTSSEKSIATNKGWTVS